MSNHWVIMATCVVLPLALLSCAEKQHISLEFLSPVPDAEAIGIFHEVQKGDTLMSICRLYGADLQEVAELNDITELSHIQIGQKIFVPDVAGLMPNEEGETVVPTPVPEGPRHIDTWQGEFIWPVEGTLTSSFGVRRGKRHDGIDIAAPLGTEVRAAANGTVLFAGNHRSGYGNLVIIKHKNNLVTVYAHNQRYFVKEGDEVQQGQVIAKVGRSGRANGPHVHFEIRDGVRPRNPMFFLKRLE
jgi:lipoprotein NlpD